MGVVGKAHLLVIVGIQTRGRAAGLGPMEREDKKPNEGRG